MFALKNVVKNYGEVKVLNGVSLIVPPKDNICIVGNGGSGKSTLLKLLVRWEDPTDGMIQVDGIDLKTVPPAILQLYRRRVGIIFQEPMLLDHATVRENIALPLELFGTPPAIVDKTVNSLLTKTGLKSKADTLAGELSLSLRSLTGIARAIVTAPMILIADEPLLHLDEAQSKIVQEMLATMHKNGTTLMVLSRNTATASMFDSRIVTLKNGRLENAQIARPAAATPQPTEQYRILEKEEKTEEVKVSEPKVNPESPHNGTEGSKKIRITSIGSL